MTKSLLRFALLGAALLPALGACNAAREDGRSSARNTKAPVARTSAVECILYDGMDKSSPQLTTIDSGAQVQVLDSINVYFVKARVSKDGKVLTGYMYRTCFPKEW